LQTHTPIELKLNSHKGLIKVHLCANFGWNLIKIYRAMIDFSCKKVKGLSCLQGKPLEGIGWIIDGVTIVGVHFCGLKRIKKKTTEI